MIRLKAPAKVNLFLRVLKKRPDGFHEIHTLFERISIFDDITLAPHPSRIAIKTSAKNIPKDSRNICWRAAELLQKEFGVKKGVTIGIRKRIPVEAGLGGGSSDAAAVLVGLNRLWKLGLSPKKLAKLGARLGSDVSFFALGVPFAEGSGRGEILRPVGKKNLKIWHVVVKPGFGISTKKAYQGLYPALLTPQKADATMALRLIEKADKKHLPGVLANTLEHVLNKRVTTNLNSIKRKLLQQGATGSLMSGSGSSVFGIFSSRKEAFSAARILKKELRGQVFVASTF
jgi:4-diphosphocytidyl-2-C-methyl-D-erythritol kinase